MSRCRCKCTEPADKPRSWSGGGRNEHRLGSDRHSYRRGVVVIVMLPKQLRVARDDKVIWSQVPGVHDTREAERVLRIDLGHEFAREPTQIFRIGLLASERTAHFGRDPLS